MSRKVIKRLAVVFATAIALVTGSSAAANANGWQEATRPARMASVDNGWQKGVPAATSPLTKPKNGWQ